MDEKKLAHLALKAQSRAYAPYSHFQVGAALACADGRIYTGANIENGAFSPSCCAERTAFYQAVLDGQRSFAARSCVNSAERILSSCWRARMA